MVSKAPSRYLSTRYARERQAEQKQRAAMHIAIACRSADSIRAIRGLMEQIIRMKTNGFTYPAIAKEIGDDLPGLDIHIPSKSLPGTIGVAFRAERNDAEAVQEMMEKIDSSPALKKKILKAVDDAGGYKVLTNPEIKRALIDAGVLTSNVAEDNPEERRLFRIALMALHHRWEAWHMAREIDL